MASTIESKKLQSDLLLPWIFLVFMLLTQAGLVFVCLYFNDEIRLAAALEPPILVRTILYFVAIATFPLINLIRYIMLRLNQTMPGEATAKSRYFITVMISLSFAETLGIYGFILYLIGDNLQTLYIFITLSVVALFLHRPKLAEYLSIVDALQQGKE
jgi:hypothetical protein